MIRAEICTLRLFFVPRKSIPLAVWSGLYIYKLFLDIFDRMGVSFDHRAPKPFTLSPILTEDSKLVHYGVLDLDKIYVVRFATNKRELIEALISSLYKNQDIPIKVIRTEVSTYCINLSNDVSSDRRKYLVDIHLRFLPTLFKFRSYEVLYPSPKRFLLSVLRDIYSLLGIDLRPLAKRILLDMELISNNTKVIKLYIGKDASGKDRIIRAFQGVARYMIVASSRYLSLLSLLFEIAQRYGVGKNRAIGLGYVEVLNYVVRPI